ncbi:MAG: class I tRNA ligase family protein, partial [Verrucomicrobiota bacterium]
HCWRSKTPVIFRAMDQWFIEIDHQNFRQSVLEEISRINWIPDWGRNRIEGLVKSRPDWCISRQRTWGVPLPAFYDGQGKAILEAQVVRNAAALVEQHGSNIWFEKSAGELWSLLKPSGWAGPEAAAKSNDTLDVWIDSGSSSRAVLMRREELQHQRAVSAPLAEGSKNTPGRMPAARWQADIYFEGSDQHRGWFQSSLLLSLAGNGAAPYKTVLTHGFMVDADREKISKSKQGQGTYEKPQTAESYIKKYGADVVRLWVASQDFRNDIVVSDERITKVGETYRVIRNALRYQLSNLYDFDPAKHSVPDDKLTGLDRWILGEFAEVENHVIAAYGAFEFHAVYQQLSQFAAVEMSAIYHDVVKDRLYTDAANSHRRRSTQTALYRMVSGLCKLLAPILSFTADEAWEFIPGNSSTSVHASEFTATSFQRSEAERELWKRLLEYRDSLLPKLEAQRQAKVIGKSLEAKVRFYAEPRLFSEWTANKDLLETFRELCNVSQFEITQDRDSELVARADGQKCERCWHWEIDVGSYPEHPTLCARCVEAIGQPLDG